MKKLKLYLAITIIFLFISPLTYAEWITDNKFYKDSIEAFKDDKNLNGYFKNAYAYLFFPRIQKAGIYLGYLQGKGAVFIDEEITGCSSIKQLSLGLTIGASQFSQIIFFQDKETFDSFKKSGLKFNSELSFQFFKWGDEIDESFYNGVFVETKKINGLMYDASLGGQSIKFKPLKNESCK
jgi:lipid-binding SYLF domain-containing protein